MNKRVLIVSYVFPPSNEVGGRRWGKFASALKRNGYEVHLITSSKGLIENGMHEKPNYIFTRTIFENKYPEILDQNPQNVFDKIKYKMALRRVKKNTKGNYYDRGIFSFEDLYKLIKEHIAKYNIDCVVGTGAPFSILYYLSLWKKEMGYRLVCDIRDPWTFGENYGIQNIEKSRFIEESRKEKFVSETADLITVPNEFMRDFYVNQLLRSSKSTMILEHGFDVHEFKLEERGLSVGITKWIYGGTLYPECESSYDVLFNYLEKHSEIQFNVYSRSKILYSSNPSNLNFCSFVSSERFNDECQKSDCFIWVFPEKFKDYLSTKFFELVYAKIPIVYIGFKGHFSDFIADNSLGIFIESDQLIDQIESIKVRLSNLVYNYDFPIENYTTDEVVKKIFVKLDECKNE